MSYTVEHGTENDGPKHTEFDDKKAAQTFADSVSGKVLPKPGSAPRAPRPSRAKTVKPPKSNETVVIDTGSTDATGK